MSTRALDRRDVDSGVQLAEVVAAIAVATDLGLGQPLDHLLRACVIANRFAEHLGASQEERDATYWVSLFTAAGCTGTSYEISQVFGDDIALRTDLFQVDSNLEMFGLMFKRAGSNRGAVGRTKVVAELVLKRMSPLIQSLIAHCAVSARLADQLGLGELVIQSVLQTFEQWNGKGIPLRLSKDEITLPMQVANLGVFVEVRAREQGAEAARKAIAYQRGRIFAPSVADRWLDAQDQMLDGIDDEAVWDNVVGMQPGGRGSLSEDELDKALALIGDYADLKSPWLVGHSRGVASLAVAAARRAGLPESDIVTLRRAAWVHDIGRNGVPNSIWDKPGPLTPLEMEKVRLHAYYTERVLHRASRLSTLATIAASAHERAGGTGYPRAIAGNTIPLLGRFIEAADCYHAMIEDRPHRPKHTRDEAAAELRRAVHAGELDGAAVDAVLAAAGHPVRRKPSAPAGLTPREVEVLVLAARGGTTRAVARQLGISPKTAGNHLERIYSKIGVSSRAEAAMFAMQNGLVPSWESSEA